MNYKEKIQEIITETTDNGGYFLLSSEKIGQLELLIQKEKAEAWEEGNKAPTKLENNIKVYNHNPYLESEE